VIAVVCTNRGTHQEKRLGWLVEEQNADGERVFALVPWVPFRDLKAGADRNRDTQRGGTLRPRKCPNCRRDVPMSQSTAARKYDEHAAAGLHRLDISTR
jgi:hypothetical protein